MLFSFSVCFRVLLIWGSLIVFSFFLLLSILPVCLGLGFLLQDAAATANDPCYAFISTHQHHHRADSKGRISSLFVCLFVSHKIHIYLMCDISELEELLLVIWLK